MVNMKSSLLYVLLLFHTVFAQTGFGNSYLKNTKLCHQWTCLNEKLHLPDSLPPREQYTEVLKTILPPEWQGIVEKTLDVCYGDKPRRYVNTCPGQALLHCVIDQFIQNCPEESWRKDDACAPLSTLAGFKYMFSQSRYENLEENLPTERRPPWFLNNYFNSKCCDLPALFNSTLLSECGFTSLIFYHVHSPRLNHVGSPAAVTPNTRTTQTVENRETVKVVDQPLPSAVKVIDQPLPSTVNVIDQPLPSTINTDQLSPKDFEDLNPLECCDISAFINPTWAAECNFNLSWTGKDRFVIKNTSVTVKDEPTTKKPKFNDVKVVPLSCEEETCIFSHLNILSTSGSVDLDAFSKLLDNMTNSHPIWTKAKGRVITQCLTKPLLYDQPCEINKVLACTLDVLSENCPHAKKGGDPCKHSNLIKEDITCQISSSKYRPKHRRQFCGVPNLVHYEVLTQCGVTSLTRLDYVPDPPVTAKPKFGWSRYTCKETSPSTKCLLNKMEVLNKYGFLDYFKMKDHIRTLNLDPFWSSLAEVYQSAFTGMPLYGDYCSSPRKLLNVVDAMLTTCPISKRKDTPQCNQMFADMMTKVPVATKSRLDRQKLDQIINRIHHVFLPLLPRYFTNHTYIHPSQVPNFRFHIHKKPKVIRNEQYNFGILNSKDVPPVKIIDVKPKAERKPLVLLPVYLRVQKRVINGTQINGTKIGEPVLDVKGKIGMIEIAKP